MVIISEILIQSFENTKIVPFALLTEAKKRTLSSLIEDEVNSMQSFHDSHSVSMFTWNKAEKIKKKQDIMDTLLRTAYPFISEGKGLTSSLTSLELPFNLKVLPQFLPEGEEDATCLTVGQQRGKPFELWVWKDGEQVFSKLPPGKSWKLTPAKIMGLEVLLRIQG